MLLRQLTVRIALAITLTALLVGCSGSGGVAPPRDVVEEAVGHYASGFEVSALVPCGSSERWWTTGIPDAEYRAIAGNMDYVDVYVRVRGIQSGPGSYGHMGAYERQFRVTEILELRAATADDCR